MSVIKTTLPLADEGMKWDAGEAIKAVKAWASDDNGDIDFTKYRKAFFFVDDDNDDDDSGGQKQGDYKLPFATIVDGDLKAVWNGVAGCMGALNGARGGVDLGDDEDEKMALYKQICVYYKKFDKEPPALAKSIKRSVGDRVNVIMSIDQTTVKDLGGGSFSCTVTTSDVDRMMESIDTQGISTDNYMNNPVVLYGHDYQGLPIGKTIKLQQFKNKMQATFQLAVEEYPFAKTVAAMIKGGYLNAVSIGGVVRQWNEDYTEIMAMEMVEFSVVPVPANPQALITGRSLEALTGKSIKEIGKEFHEFVEKSVTDKVKDLDNAELVRHIETLEKLLAILKATADKKAESRPENEVIRLTLKKSANEMARTSEKIIRIVKAKE